MKFTIQSATRRNDMTKGKPNEDFHFYDKEQGLILLLDGISRPAGEYPVSEEDSVVCRLNRLFADCFSRFFLQEFSALPPVDRLKKSLIRANREIASLTQEKSLEEWGFYPGTVGIAAFLQNDRLYFAYAGDCVGVLIRQDSALFFGREDAISFSEKEIPERIRRYAVFCNRSETPFGFGTFNGDPRLENMVRGSFLDLQREDTLLFSTDGAQKYLQFESTKKLARLTPEEIITASLALDRAPFAKYQDDKTVIRVKIL